MEQSEQITSRPSSDSVIQADPARADKQTDSMVTVPLTSNSEDTQPDWRTLDIPQTPVDSTTHSDSELSPRTTPTSAKPDLGSELARTRTSEENDQTDVLGGDAVDWEELERTEEQEPRMEGSDEVCLIHGGLVRLTL